MARGRLPIHVQVQVRYRIKGLEGAGGSTSCDMYPDGDLAGPCLGHGALPSVVTAGPSHRCPAPAANWLTSASDSDA